MKVLIGTFNTDHGSVETTPAGLVYGGDEPEKVQAIVESVRDWYDRSGIKHTLSDKELVRSLPYRLHGYILWAVYVDDQTGITVDQPPYDPWGEVWRSPNTPPVSQHRKLIPFTGLGVSQRCDTTRYQMA
jgi:hypothetical protein